MIPSILGGGEEEEEGEKERRRGGKINNGKEEKSKEGGKGGAFYPHLPLARYDRSKRDTRKDVQKSNSLVAQEYRCATHYAAKSDLDLRL